MDFPVAVEYQRLLRLAFPERYRAYDLTPSRKRSRLVRGRSDAAKSYARNWCRSHKNSVAGYQRKYYSTPAGRAAHREKCRRRTAVRLGATIGSPAGTQKIYARAAWWRQWFPVVVDHIIPLSRGGAHALENLQIILACENSVKGARLDYVPQIIFR